MSIRRLYRILYAWIKLFIHGVHFRFRVSANRIYIKNKGEIHISNHVNLNSFPDGSCHRTALSTYFPDALIKIGSHCNLNGLIIHCNEKVIIGDHCMFGPGSIISDNDSHVVDIDHARRNETPVSKPVIIGENVWVGMNCTILKGVTIGKNSIIAACSLVLNGVPPNSLYGGHPAKLIKRIG